jgi:hypothetical protein
MSYIHIPEQGVYQYERQLGRGYLYDYARARVAEFRDLIGITSSSSPLISSYHITVSPT